MTKTSFDDRSHTEISQSIKKHKRISSTPIQLEFDNLFSWTKTHELSAHINTPDFIVAYGAAVVICPSSVYISIGTENGFVVVYNYHQQVQFVLSPFSPDSVPALDSPYLQQNSVTAISISPDLSTVAAGYIDGKIVVWELDEAEKSPYHTIEPITLDQRFNQGREGHLNQPITGLELFLNHQIVSVDVSGLIFYHHGFKKLLTKHFLSQKVWGTNDANAVPSPKHIVHSIKFLPLGNVPQITDQLGLLAVLTGEKIMILSLFSLDNPTNLLVKNHFHLHVPKSVKIQSDTVGCIDWFPCIQYDTFVPAKLAYSWNNCVTVIELNNALLPSNLMSVLNDLREKDKSIPILPFIKTARKYVDHRLIAIKWLSTNSLCLFASETVLVYHYHEKTLTQIGYDSMTYKPKKIDFKMNRDFLVTSYQNCIRGVKTRLVILNDRSHQGEIILGKPISWNDKIAEFFIKKNYESALKTCYYFYSSTNIGQLVLFSLPEKERTRKKLVYPYLIKTINLSILIYKNLPLYLEIISTLIKDTSDDLQFSEILELLYETYDTKEFFVHLEEYLISGSIVRLSPLVLKQLVIYYGEANMGSQLTEILCTVDISMLDIDLALQICRKNRLEDCLVFIYNYLLHDFRTPLAYFLKRVQDPGTESKVYMYLSYILTGRQYPIDKYIDINEEQNAKTSTIQLLFGHDNRVGDIELDKSSIFPVLTMLLKHNSFEMLSSLNEFFEDSMLNNESETITRQFIVDALLDIFASNEFTNHDKCNLSIFIGRNYPKYSQFIRLSDFILNQILENLLNFNHSENKVDCELAIQSLLSAFEPFDEGKLIEQLTFKKFYSVLISIYKGEGKYHKVLHIWLDQFKENPQRIGREEFFIVFGECLKNTKLGSDKVNLIHLIRENFKIFLLIDLRHFVSLINDYDSSLHKLVLSVEDEDLIFKYLDELFVTISKPTDDSLLIMKYVDGLCHRDDYPLYKFLSKTFTSIDETDWDTLEKVLRQQNQINSLTILLNHQHKYQMSLDELLKYLYENAEAPDFDEAFKLYVEILEHPVFHNQSDELNLNEQYWLNLIDTLIALSRTSPKINDYIYKSFRRISDIKLNPNDKNESSFLKIFDTFLNNNDQTTLLNIRNILIDILISYSYESEILRMNSKILNQNILDKLDLIKFDHLRGWNITCKNCTNCGKKLYGSEIDFRNYIVWEQNQLQKLNMANFDENDQSLRLIFFKCSHGYHYNCLKNLHSEVCLICSS